jgi:hypothetical protein
MNEMDLQRLRKKLMKDKGRVDVSNKMVEPCDDPGCGLCTKELGAKDPQNLNKPLK